MPRYFEDPTRTPTGPGDTLAEQSFRIVTQEMGGREDVVKFSELRSAHWGHVEAIRRQSEVHHSAMRGIYLDFVANGCLDAFADTSTPYDLIGINRGTIQNVGVFFYTTFSCPGVYTGWGDQGKEIQRFKSLSGIRWTDDCTSFVRDLTRKGVAIDQLPQCSERRRLAERLARMAIDFILFHEVGHILYGHTDLVGEFSGSKRIREFGTSAGMSTQTSQAIELHADSFAI